MRRIAFDSNTRDMQGRYVLSLPGSLETIRGLGSPLELGERIKIYMEDLEGEGVVEWNPSEPWSGFVVRADEAKWRIPE